MATTRKKNGADSTANPDSNIVDKICFTIMPFGGWFDTYYTDIYKPAIESCGLIAKRADDLYRPSTIVNDIWYYTKKAEIILADLTSKNPNVFYELGLAHAITKPAVLITESIEDVPFDLRALRIIEYDKNAPDWGNVLRAKIEASITEVLESPLEAVLPAFLNVADRDAVGEVTPQERDMIELKQEVDLIRRELASSARKFVPSRQSKYLPQDEALTIIKDLLSSGLSDEEIMTRIKDIIPNAWAFGKIMEFRDKQLAEDAVKLMNVESIVRG